MSNFLSTPRHATPVIPMITRTDCGTENVTIAGMMAYLRRFHDDRYAAERSHIYGPSKHNVSVLLFDSSDS